MFRTIALASLVSLSAFSGALAEDKPTLTIYTYDAFAADWGPGPQLKSGFEATCNCTIDIVAVDSSLGALRRAQLEGESTDADIILGLDMATVQVARDTGLFTSANVDLAGLELPIEWTADDFVPFDYGYFAFVYRPADLPNPPSNFLALAEDEDLKVAIQDPRSSTPGLGLVLWLKAAHGDDTSEAWREISEQVLTVAGSWSEAYGLFLEGEADMALSYTTSPAYHIIAEEDSSVAAATFSEGHYLQVEVAGVLKSSPNQELANQFLTYLISDDAQAIIPTTNWMYPVAPIDLPEGFPARPDDFEVLLLPEAEVAANQKTWIDEMLAAFE